MINVAVCDDDANFIEIFSTAVSDNIGNDLESVDRYRNISTLMYSDKVYDLIFLNIDMPGANELYQAKYYDAADSFVVFLSKKQELIFESFNSTNAFGFIRKSQIPHDLDVVMNKFYKTKQRNGTLSVKKDYQVFSIRYSDIIYIEKSSNYVIIHSKNGIFTERSTLIKYENLLKHEGFLRVHAGYMVNIYYILCINSNNVTLMNNEMIPLSRKNMKTLKAQFLKRKPTNPNDFIGGAIYKS